MTAPKPPERATPVNFGVTWSKGAPEPHLIQSERRTFLAFHLKDVPFDSADVTSGVEQIAVIEWLRSEGAVLVGIDERAIAGHRLHRLSRPSLQSTGSSLKPEVSALFPVWPSCCNRGWFDRWMWRQPLATRDR